jgi:lipopolysaccharide export system permease protein
VCAVFLVVDFVDRAKAYRGDGWQAAAAELYGYKLIVVAYQLAPAALLVGAGVTLAGVRRRGEYTALCALAVGPLQVLLPIAAVTLGACGGLMIADEALVGYASRRVDEITAGRFRSFGDWRTFFGQTRWFRGKTHIYHLRDGDAEQGFTNVTMLSLSDDFRLARRMDAREMRPAGGRRWTLVDGLERQLGETASPLRRFAVETVELEEDPTSFHIVKGRPEQLGLSELGEQIRLREKVGRPVERFLLARHNKAAYPLAGLPAAVLAGALALRPSRKGALTEALTDGFMVIVGLWAAMVVFKAAALAGHLGPAAAAWAPVALMTLLAATALRGVSR